MQTSELLNLRQKYHKLWPWLAVVFIVAGFLLAFFMPHIVTNIDMRLAVYFDKWVAVYLDNEQIFYGHIATFNFNVIKLTDVYYLSTVSVGEQQNTTLVKRGQSEISSPENALFISRSHILYFENMKPDGQIMKIISENEAKK